MIDRICKLIVDMTGKALHLPTMELFYGMEQTLDGKLVVARRERAHSWNRNAYNLVFASVAGAGNTGGFAAGGLSMKDTGGAIDSSSAVLGANPGGYSIQLGSNNAAVTFDDYHIHTAIGDGMETGQVNYGSQYVSSSGWPTVTIRIKRYFNNNSGAAVDIGEIAFYISGYMMSREVYDPKTSFLDKAQLQVYYDLSMTYPS